MKYAASVLAAVSVVGAGIGAPHVLSRFAFFEIRTVEIVGLQHLAPDQILDAAGLVEHGNLFRDLESVEQRVSNVPGVVNVDLQRRLPGTLRIEIEETVPVAFAVAPGALITLDVDASPLPFDPTASDLDLPVIKNADETLTFVLNELREVDRGFFNAIETAERSPGGGVVLIAGQQRFLLPEHPSRETTVSLAVVRQQFLETNTEFAELDARYEGMVVMRGSVR